MSKLKKATTNAALEPLSPRETTNGSPQGRGRGEGTAGVRHFANPEPSSGASRHLLPEGEGTRPHARHSRSSQPPNGGSSGNPATLTPPCVPADWRESVLGEEISLQYGKSLRTDKREAGNFNVYGSNGIVGHHSTAAVTGPGIIVGRKGSVGEVVYSPNDFWPIDTTYYVENKHDNNWLFVYYLLTTLGLSSLNSHSAVPGLNRESAYPIRCLVPPKPEQQKIAAVLWKMQRAIATQDRLIAATRDLKQSAMQHLFTHGLRGEPLKQTELGPSPQSWQLAPIGKLGHVVTGSTPKTAKREYYADGTLHFIAPGDMGHATEIRSTAKKITEAGMQVSRMLPRGSTCVVCIGSSIGKVGITTRDRSTTNQQINAVVPSSDFDTDYVCYLLQYHSELITSRAAPSPVPILSKSQFSSIELPISLNTHEQRDIAAALAAIDRKLAHHQQKRAALNDLFQTTLHQLMTAQIRVADLDIDTSDVTTPKPQGIAA